jgi:hypothetical protein
LCGTGGLRDFSGVDGQGIASCSSVPELAAFSAAANLRFAAAAEALVEAISAVQTSENRAESGDFCRIRAAAGGGPELGCPGVDF